MGLSPMLCATTEAGKLGHQCVARRVIPDLFRGDRLPAVKSIRLIREFSSECGMRRIDAATRRKILEDIKNHRFVGMCSWGCPADREWDIRQRLLRSNITPSNGRAMILVRSPKPYSSSPARALSIYPGMGKALAAEFPSAQRVFDEANDALGFNLARLCCEGPEQDLKLTANTQPALLTISTAAFRILEERGWQPGFRGGSQPGRILGAGHPR